MLLRLWLLYASETLQLISDCIVHEALKWRVFVNNGFGSGKEMVVDALKIGIISVGLHAKSQQLLSRSAIKSINQSINQPTEQPM
jgi:hypothetical protein